jgi:hypothetical protein
MNKSAQIQVHSKSQENDTNRDVPLWLQAGVKVSKKGCRGRG